MTEKEQQIEYWKRTASEDLEAIELLFRGKKYLHGLFFCHLSIEKLLKALWIKHNPGNHPPKTHNLIFLYSQTGIELADEQSDFLRP